jgi:hypothetical protein
MVWDKDEWLYMRKITMKYKLFLFIKAARVSKKRIYYRRVQASTFYNFIPKKYVL